MPALNFLNGVKNSNGDKDKININTSIDFASLLEKVILKIIDKRLKSLIKQLIKELTL